MKRGEKEGVLSLQLNIEDERAIIFIESKIVTNRQFIFYEDIVKAVKDSYKRLIFPSIETDVMNFKT